MIIVPVPLGNRSYDVVVGDGAIRTLSTLLPAESQRAAVVTQTAVNLEVETGIEQKVFTIDKGEEAKTLSTVEQLCRQFASFGLTRADVVVSVGGGLVSDVAGFAAAVYHRGVAVIHVSTTLLGQIDAAIGGKTGVNLPEGKNLVGAFWQPHAVICDTETLSTLPKREFRSGLGELAKYHFLGGGDLDALPLAQRVAACVEIKAQVVANDEREGGRRAILNYGHTLGHAIELLSGFDLRHGEAVAVGLVYAAELAFALGRIDAARVAEHRRVVHEYGLPSTIPTGLSDDAIMGALRRDKKMLNSLTFALDGAQGVEVVSNVDASIVRSMLAKVR